MKRLESLIRIARELSQNTRYDSTSGLSQVVFNRFFKNAQDNLYKGIQNTKSKFYLKEVTESVVASQQEYDYPFDIYLRAIDTIEWSQYTSITNENTWIVLDKAIEKERLSNNNGWPFSYIVKEDYYLLNPPLESGSLRINYIRKLPEIEKRSGRVSAVTMSGQTLSALTIDPAEESFDPSYLNTENYICIVDMYGRLKARGITYTSVNSTTGVFTLSSQTVVDSGTIAIGDYVCVGEYSVNLPEMADICESYLIKHAVYEAKYGDSSNWTSAAIRDMDVCLKGIIDSYARLSDDITQVPITNVDYLEIW